MVLSSLTSWVVCYIDVNRSWTWPVVYVLTTCETHWIVYCVTVIISWEGLLVSGVVSVHQNSHITIIAIITTGVDIISFIGIYYIYMFIIEWSIIDWYSDLTYIENNVHSMTALSVYMCVCVCLCLSLSVYLHASLKLPIVINADIIM